MLDQFESLQTLPPTVDVQILRLQQSPTWYVRLETDGFVFEAHGALEEAVQNALAEYKSDFYHG